MSRLDDLAAVSSPEIKFQKINPTKYKIHVSNSDQSFNLIFNESFHKGWKLYLATKNPDSASTEVVRNYFGKITELVPSNNLLDPRPLETLRMKQLVEDSHRIVNGYANSWRISPEDVGGLEDYELVIEFKPQITFYYGVILSFVTIFLTGVLAIIEYVKKK